MLDVCLVCLLMLWMWYAVFERRGSDHLHLIHVVHDGYWEYYYYLGAVNYIAQALLSWIIQAVVRHVVVTASELVMIVRCYVFYLVASFFEMVIDTLNNYLLGGGGGGGLSFELFNT